MGRNAPRTSTANQPCKGSKRRKPTTSKFIYKVATNKNKHPLQKKEKAGGVKQPSKALRRRLTKPPSNVAQRQKQPHLAELKRSKKMVTRTSNKQTGTSHCKQTPICCTLTYTSPQQTPKPRAPLLKRRTATSHRAMQVRVGWHLLPNCANLGQ